jgi:hypothetical protein
MGREQGTSPMQLSTTPKLCRFKIQKLDLRSAVNRHHRSWVTIATAHRYRDAERIAATAITRRTMLRIRPIAA